MHKFSAQHKTVNSRTRAPMAGPTWAFCRAGYSRRAFALVSVFPGR